MTESAQEKQESPFQRGAEVIRKFLRTLPAAPGVYRMIDENEQILYVGKAKNLKNRVSSYTKPAGQSTRIMRMVSLTHAMEFVSTHTEVEALLLEANLIKKLKPRYNIILRDDKSFPYILITGDHQWPQITKHRGKRNRKGEYFGPFASAGAVNETLATFQRLFPLRSCSDSDFETRTRLACNTRSSGALPRAWTVSLMQIIKLWCRRRGSFSLARATISNRPLPTKCKMPAMIWILNWQLYIGIA